MKDIPVSATPESRIPRCRRRAALGSFSGVIANSAMPTSSRTLCGTICWAIASGQMPADLARLVQDNLDRFRAAGEPFDSLRLSGPAKRAELIVKLGYWLAVGQLSEREFRLWSECIPDDEDNAGWDVDLLQAEAGPHFRRALKMGPLATRPTSCLVQETGWLPIAR